MERGISGTGGAFQLSGEGKMTVGAVPPIGMRVEVQGSSHTIRRRGFRSTFKSYSDTFIFQIIILPTWGLLWLIEMHTMEINLIKPT